MKTKRHNEILHIIENYDIDTQGELQIILRQRGYNVTQATVSRDIKELKLIKRMDSNGIYKYGLPNTNKKKRGILADTVKSVDYAINTVVVRCHTGMAQAACAEIDSMELNEIVGTLAGDDTIFILLRTEDESKNFIKRLKIIVNE